MEWEKMEKRETWKTLLHVSEKKYGNHQQQEFKFSCPGGIKVTGYFMCSAHMRYQAQGELLCDL